MASLETESSSLRAQLLRVEVAALSLDRPPSSLPGAELPGALQGEFDVLTNLLRPSRAGDVAAVLKAQWLAPVAAALTRERVDTALAKDAGGFARLRGEIQEACKAFVAAAPCPGAEEVRGLGLLLLGQASLQLYLRATWTGPPLEADEARSLPFEPMATAVNETFAAELLETLECDGEPVYELIVGAGFLWLAAVLLGALPDSEALATGHTLALWRGRCAFAWQHSLAEATERGLGQSPRLFCLSVHDLIGTAVAPGPLAGKGLLSGEVLSTLRETTAPVVRVCQAQARASAGPPVVLGVISEEDVERAGVGKGEGKSEGKVGLEVAVVELTSAPGATRSALIVELLGRLVWYGRSKPFEEVMQAACVALGSFFKITGAMGIKRKYQTVEFAQFAVQVWCPDSASAATPPLKAVADDAKEAAKAADSGEADAEGAKVETADGEAAEAPTGLSLLECDDMTDILEKTKLSAEYDEAERLTFERPLKAAEQLLLLAKCQYLWATGNAEDELLLEEINALGHRVLMTDKMPKDEKVDGTLAVVQEETGDEDAADAAAQAAADGPMLTANWLNFSCGLYFRCRAEHHRNKTRERAAFQLQSLVDQYADKKPSAGHRLACVHAACYPARFHLQREMGLRMMRMGMVSTAHEQFKKLRMWPEAIDCLMIADRNVEATDMVKELIAEAPTPRLWSSLGDLERNIAHHETAWELSKGRFARAQRSMGRMYFQKGEMVKAVDAFRKSLGINPLHSEVWFTMGVAEMQLKRWDTGVQTFARCIGIDDEHTEAWANLAACHSALGSIREAKTCMVEATKRCRSNWRMFESLLGMCMQLRDVQGAIQAMRRLVELHQASRIEERVLGILTMSIVCDRDGLSDERTGKAFATRMMSFFEYLTSQSASEPYFWRFYAELQESQGQRVASVESRFRQTRAAQRLWTQADPERFSSELEDLCECYEALEDVLADPSFAAEARQRWQPFAYSVRNAERQLRAKVEGAGNAPEKWQEALAKLTPLAARVEARAELVGGVGETDAKTKEGGGYAAASGGAA